MYLKIKEPNISEAFSEEMAKFLYYPNYVSNPQIVIDAIEKNLCLIADIEEFILNRQKYSDEEFLKKVLNYCHIILTRQNSLNILSKTYNKKYVDYLFLESDMILKKKDIDGQIKSYICAFVVMFDENVIFKNSLYSADELQEMIERKDILIVDEYFSEVQDLDFPHSSYIYLPQINIYDFSLNPLEITTVSNKYVRKRLTTKALQTSLNLYKQALILDIKKTLSLEEKFKYEADYAKRCGTSLKNNKNTLSLIRALR